MKPRIPTFGLIGWTVSLLSLGAGIVLFVVGGAKQWSQISGSADIQTYAATEISLSPLGTALIAASVLSLVAMSITERVLRDKNTPSAQ